MAMPMPMPRDADQFIHMIFNPLFYHDITILFTYAYDNNLFTPSDLQDLALAVALQYPVPTDFLQFIPRGPDGHPVTISDTSVTIESITTDAATTDDIVDFSDIDSVPDHFFAPNDDEDDEDYDADDYLADDYLADDYLADDYRADHADFLIQNMD